MFNQEKLPIIRRDDISNLKECIVTEIFVKMNFVSSRSYIGSLAKIVHSSSGCHSLDIFMNNINSLNPTISIIPGNFNRNYSKQHF